MTSLTGISSSVFLVNSCSLRCDQKLASGAQVAKTVACNLASWAWDFSGSSLPSAPLILWSNFGTAWSGGRARLWIFLSYFQSFPFREASVKGFANEIIHYSCHFLGCWLIIGLWIQFDLLFPIRRVLLPVALPFPRAFWLLVLYWYEGRFCSPRGNGSAALCGTGTSLLHGIGTLMVWIRCWDEAVLETCGEVGTCKCSATS